MKTVPSIVIVADRGHLLAYRSRKNGSFEQIDSSIIPEGNSKISDIVTDQSGAFPVSGGQGTAAYESMPLIAELEVRCFRKIAAEIKEIIGREKPGRWGFAAPSEINGAIVDHLDPELREHLSVNLKLDLTNVPKTEIHRRFADA